PHEVEATYCFGDSVVVYGVVYDEPGTYIDTIPSTTGGCDTVVMIEIEELELIDHEVSAAFCAGSSVTVYGIVYDEAGIYFDTIPSLTGGCDTAVVITIVEDQLPEFDINYVGCSGDGYSVTINGVV